MATRQQSRFPWRTAVHFCLSLWTGVHVWSHCRDLHTILLLAGQGETMITVMLQFWYSPPHEHLCWSLFVIRSLWCACDKHVTGGQLANVPLHPQHLHHNVSSRLGDLHSADYDIIMTWSWSHAYMWGTQQHPEVVDEVDQVWEVHSQA